MKQAMVESAREVRGSVREGRRGEESSECVSWKDVVKDGS